MMLPSDAPHQRAVIISMSIKSVHVFVFLCAFVFSPGGN